MKLDEVQQAAQEQFARRSHRYGHGHILENVEDVREAIEPLQRAVEGDPSNAAAHYQLGEAYNQTDRLREALQAFFPPI